MKHSTLLIGAASLMITSTSTHAVGGGFHGFFLSPYEPGTWTITGAGGVGGPSATFGPGGVGLTIVGGDSGQSSTIDVTHVVLGTGFWSFDWIYSGFNGTPGFDAGYYLVDGEQFLLSDAIGVPAASGSVDVPVIAGQTIGWRVHTVDGIFGAGMLTIDAFRAPVPAPATLVLLGLAGLARARRRE